MNLTKAIPVTVEDISARIDRLPYSRWHTKVLGVVGTANFFDAFDLLTIAFVMPMLVTLWALSPTEVGLLISAGYIGQLLGSLAFSTLAEKFGRRSALVWTIWIISGFSFACAFSWNYTMLIVFRLFQGIGLGGEVPVSAAYFNELIPSKARGKAFSLTRAFFAFGIFGCSLIASSEVPRHPSDLF